MRCACIPWAASVLALFVLAPGMAVFAAEPAEKAQAALPPAPDDWPGIGSGKVGDYLARVENDPELKRRVVPMLKPLVTRIRETRGPEAFLAELELFPLLDASADAALAARKEGLADDAPPVERTLQALQAAMENFGVRFLVYPKTLLDEIAVLDCARLWLGQQVLDAEELQARRALAAVERGPARPDVVRRPARRFSSVAELRAAQFKERRQARADALVQARQVQAVAQSQAPPRPQNSVSPLLYYMLLNGGAMNRPFYENVSHAGNETFINGFGPYGPFYETIIGSGNQTNINGFGPYGPFYENISRSGNQTNINGFGIMPFYGGYGPGY